MTTTVTKTDIIAALHQFGLTAGDAVEVHSSLSSMGFVEGGPETIIEALMDVVGNDGAIVMSAHKVSLPYPPTEEEAVEVMLNRVRMYGEHDEGFKSGMGIVADTFRDREDTLLGTGLHRVCAWGKNAELHAKGYQHLVDSDGWVLLIGVDIHTCSSMHLVEWGTKPQEVKDYHQTPQHLLDRYPLPNWWVEYRDPQKPPLEDAWGKVFAEADRRGLVQRGKIGDADCLFFKAKPMTDIHLDWLLRDALGLYGLEKV